MNNQLAIFDLDGTILDTLEDLKNSLNFALSKYGFPNRSLSEVRMFVGNGIRKLIERGVPNGTKVDIIDKVHQDFTEHYKLHCADNTSPYDGILDVFNTLKSEGVKIAIVSNKADYAVGQLCKQYFDGLYDIAVGEKTGVRKKPAPDSVNSVLELLNMERDNSVYIGDSEVDIKTAQNAGMDCISVSWGFRDIDFLKENGAKIILSSPSELLKYI